MLLEHKTALITGAGRGIGRGIARTFAEQGCDIVAVARSMDELAITEKEVRSLGRRALVIQCDISDPEAVASMAQQALAEFSFIDILVNNAGYAEFKPFTELNLEGWQRTLEVNLTGPFLCIKALLPSMMKQHKGRIINISSVAGLKPITDQSAYCASKHGLNGLTAVLAMELRAYGIAVHAICPGGVDTRLAQEAMPQRDKTDWLQPEDIAHAALYLASLSRRAATDFLMVRRFDSVPIGG